MRIHIFILICLFIFLSYNSSFAARMYGCTSLTGGGSGALDALDITGVGNPNTNSLENNDAAIIGEISGINPYFYFYLFDADGTDAEDDPMIIRPDDYSTGGVWRLVFYKCRNNYNASVSPDTDDDTGDGYCAGSVWHDTTSDPPERWVCLDATASAAVWLNTTGEPNISGTDTYVCFQDGTVRVCNDSGLSFNKTTDVLTAGGFYVAPTAYGGQLTYFYEDTDNGGNYVGIGSPASNANDLILLLPTSDPTATNRKLIGAVPSSVTGSDNVARDSSQLSWADDTESVGIACSDESTDLTTGTAKVTFRMPFAMTVTEVRSNVNTAPVGSTLVVDINEGGTTILSTKLSIDASEETSTTAATPSVISDSALADDAEITIDIDQIGSSTAGKGLKIWIIGTKS